MGLTRFTAMVESITGLDDDLAVRLRGFCENLVLEQEKRTRGQVPRSAASREHGNHAVDLAATTAVSQSDERLLDGPALGRKNPVEAAGNVTEGEVDGDATGQGKE
ncbi:MAG: hypothetical protein Q9208_008333, partial [Pyrenodesmia sp. 3 TL-2023]